MYSKIISS